MTESKYTISIASDHHGIEIKSQIITILKSEKHKLIDLGPYNEDAVDYPDYAQKLCNNILDKSSEFGILICGTGIGMSISANRYSHIRAALCTNLFMAERARAHNDANVLVLGTKVSTQKESIEMTLKFLSTTFEGGRHMKRIAKIR